MPYAYCRHSTTIFRPLCRLRVADMVPQFADSHALRRYSTAICRFGASRGRRKNPLSQHLPQTHFYHLLQHPTDMSTTTNWSDIFHDTLADYVQEYMEAYGDPVARVQILKDCQIDIIRSPLHEEQTIELPQNICCVSILFY
jgi:hypothetical protein